MSVLGEQKLEQTITQVTLSSSVQGREILHKIEKLRWAAIKSITPANKDTLFAILKAMSSFHVAKEEERVGRCLANGLILTEACPGSSWK